MLVESSGMGINGWTLSVKQEEWRQCVACPSYRGCYDLSKTTLLLHQAMQSFGRARAL
jgi:hypothetical protein